MFFPSSGGRPARLLAAGTATSCRPRRLQEDAACLLAPGACDRAASARCATDEESLQILSAGAGEEFTGFAARSGQNGSTALEAGCPSRSWRSPIQHNKD